MGKGKRLAVCFFLLLILLQASAQRTYPKNYFRSPIGFAISLAGSFGELRKNHLHSGTDIRTEGVQGKPVYAAADGYVSRVNVSPGGFGKALYITHPNGYVTVYGHLKSYVGSIAAWVKTEQYKNESFALDREVPEGLIKVRKGELVAYSGNSGASGGPHLHFEIRDARTQEAINPLCFGLMPPDDIPPRITALKVFPFDETSMVNFAAKSETIPVVLSGGKNILKTEDTIIVSGNIVFGIETSDIGEGGMKTGVYSIALKVDGGLVFSQVMERFAFTETRYANALMDYETFVKGTRKIQRSYVAPNNKLSVYREVKNRGILNFSDRRTHSVEYVVKDVFGNTTTLNFSVKSHLPASSRPRPTYTGAQLFTYKNDNHFERPGIRLDVPKEALYEELAFEYEVTGQVAGYYAPVHHLHNHFTPLQTACTLALKTINLPASMADKAVIVQILPGNKHACVGGKFAGGFLTAQIREFGDYSVLIDDTPPVIRPVNIANNKKIGKQSALLIKISDNLSGIKTYRGMLNGKWILMDYDAKSNLLTYLFDDRLKKGKNDFTLIVADGVGNIARYKAVLIR